MGWVHVGAIQIIIKSTFKEGINTPIELAAMDNRIQNREEACLGILRGNLQYGKLKFNIYPRISYNIQDKEFDKTLSLLLDFKRKDFFKQQNRPYSITYAISYAVSNTHHSECFSIKDTIDFQEVKSHPLIMACNAFWIEKCSSNIIFFFTNYIIIST